MSNRLILGSSAITAIVVTLLTAFGVAEVVELPVRDAILRMFPARQAQFTSVVAIDEESLRARGPWPWPREDVARLVARIAESGARGVVLDIVLSEPRDGDAVLAAASARLPSLGVAALDERGEWLLPNGMLRPAVIPVHGNFEVDGDGILRRIATTKQSRGIALTAMSLSAASLIDGRPVAAGVVVAPAFRARARAIPRVSAIALLAKPDQALRGRVVYVGPTALALGDRVLTPTSTRVPDPGVTVHAAATESILRGDVIRAVPPVASGFLAALLVFVTLGDRRPPRHRLLRAGFLMLSIAAISVAALGYGFALPSLVLLLAVAIAAAALEVTRASETRRRSAIAATKMESGLGLAPATGEDVAPRLDLIAEMLVSKRTEDAEAKRMLAHELKTPLASMRGLTQLLNSFQLSEPERQRVAALLEHEAGKLEVMVNSLLEIERLSARSFDANAYRLDLSHLVDARIRFLQASTERPLKSKAEPGMAVRGDAVLLERVIDNLVGNALKYSPDTEPVEIRLRQEHASAVLEVEDHGAGIPADERERIFTRFFRGSTARGTDGLGLGLAMVAEIVRWHHGLLEVVPPSGAGSIFRVSLPVARNH